MHSLPVLLFFQPPCSPWPPCEILVFPSAFPVEFFILSLSITRVRSVVSSRRQKGVSMRSLCITAFLIGLGATHAAGAADTQAGKAVAQAKCSQCHDADDWEG